MCFKYGMIMCPLNGLFGQLDTVLDTIGNFSQQNIAQNFIEMRLDHKIPNQQSIQMLLESMIPTRPIGHVAILLSIQQALTFHESDLIHQALKLSGGWDHFPKVQRIFAHCNVPCTFSTPLRCQKSLAHVCKRRNEKSILFFEV